MPLAVLGYCTSTSGAISGPAKLRLYSLAIYENDAIAHYYKPYRSADGTHVGLKDLCTGKVLLNARNGTSFSFGGDISDDPAWDLDGVEQPEIAEPARMRPVLKVRDTVMANSAVPASMMAMWTASAPDTMV